MSDGTLLGLAGLVLLGLPPLVYLCSYLITAARLRCESRHLRKMFDRYGDDYVDKDERNEK